MGRVWRVPKPVVFRPLQRLELLGLVRTTEQQPSSQCPVRSLVDATPAGRSAASGGPTRPASHNRDVRSELLVKLALLDRAGKDPQPDRQQPACTSAGKPAGSGRSSCPGFIASHARLMSPELT